MENMLHSKDMYDLVEDATAKPIDIFDSDSKKITRKTIVIITPWVDLSLYPQVQDETDAK
jgi:hypothetical protein